MLKKFTFACLLLLVAGLGYQFYAPAQVKAQDEPAKPEAAKPAAEKAAPEDIFAVPAGNDSKVLTAFLQKLSQTPPTERTPDGIKNHLLGLDKAVEEILTREVNDELFTSAVAVRLQILQILPQFGEATAVAKRAKLMDQLKHDERPAIKEMVAEMEMGEKLAKLPELSAEEKQAFVQEVATKLQAAPVDDLQQLQTGIQMAMQVAQILERSGDTEQAIAANNLFAKYIAAKNFPQGAELVKRMEATVRRLSLMGNTMDVVGTTFEGEKFDLKSLQGKVVLVDFWATWCGPCIAELPNVKNLYNAYHAKGFEVVGISLDEDKEALEQFLDKQDIEWTTLFETDPEQQGWENPISRHYGISGIPTAILVDQAGKVVSLNARGPELQESLEKLLGPADDVDAPPAATKE